MAQQYNLGKVALTPRGSYNASATYEQLDVVTYNGSSYIVLQSVTGVTPPNATYYQLIASKGNAGTNGTAATISAGTVTMLALGSNPTVTNVGTSNSAVFNFGIPYSPVSDNSVTTDKIADEAITESKLDSSIQDIFYILANGSGQIDITNFELVNFTISNTTSIQTSTSKSRQLKIEKYWKQIVITARSSYPTYITFFKQHIPPNETSGTSETDNLATGETGRRQIAAGTTVTFSVPTDAKYAILHTVNTYGGDVSPASTVIYTPIGVAMRG